MIAFTSCSPERVVSFSKDVPCRLCTRMIILGIYWHLNEGNSDMSWVLPRDLHWFVKLSLQSHSTAITATKLCCVNIELGLYSWIGVVWRTSCKWWVLFGASYMNWSKALMNTPLPFMNTTLAHYIQSTIWWQQK